MSRKLFVGNLPYSVTSERLQEAFSQFGTVASSKVIVDRAIIVHNQQAGIFFCDGSIHGTFSLSD